MIVNEKRCYGKFELATILVDKDINLIADVFSKMKLVAFRVEHNYMVDRFMYEGWSPLFRELECGQIIPTYKIIITRKSKDEEPDVVVEEIV